MKKLMNRIWTLGLLLMISAVALAQEAPVKVDLNESYTGGTVVVSGYDTSAGDGSVVVTITVSPAEGYKIAKSDILVVSTVPASGTREGSPSIADNLQLKGEDPENLSDKRDYTFTVPSGLGAWVKEAKFSEVGEQPQPQPQEDPADISAEGSELKWDYAEDTGTLVITGTGSTMNFGSENDPWTAIRSSITNVVIEKEVTGLGAGTFSGCTNLTSITVNNYNQVLTLGEDAVPTKEGLTVYVPANLMTEYNMTDGWKTLTINANGDWEQMAGITFSANNGYDTFAAGEKALIVPSVLKAYTITAINGTGLKLEEVDIINPGQAVIVYNAKNVPSDLKIYTAPTTNETKGGGANLLTVAKEDTDVKLGDAYILHNDVFYYCQAGTIPKGHVYLPNSEPAKTRGYYSLNGDGTTAIDPLFINKMESRSVWYTLDGHQLPAAPTKKGLYIKDGKKVIIK